MLAAEEADMLADYGADEHSTRVEQHRRQARRLLHSAASAVEALHGLRREDLFGKAYLLRTNDPLAGENRS